MTRGGVNEILPGVLYQRANMLKWPKEQKEKLLDELGITVVVNLWSKVDPDMSHPSRIYLNYPMTSKSPDENTAHVMTAAVVDLLLAGHKVLIHCEAGRNRSVWLTTRVVARMKAWSIREAGAHVYAAVPGAKLRPELADNLYDLEKT
jgi:hypothetical protein